MYCTRTVITTFYFRTSVPITDCTSKTESRVDTVEKFSYSNNNNYIIDGIKILSRLVSRAKDGTYRYV